MSLITGIHHVCLKCQTKEEYDKVFDFYRNVLEMPVARSWEGGIMFDTGAGLIEVFANGQDHPEASVIRHFALATGNVDRCVEKVKAAGYEVFMQPTDICIPSEIPFPARVAFCRGPLGEEIEFFQEA